MSAPRFALAADPPAATLRSRSVRGGAVALTTQALKFALTMGATVVMARLLTPEDYGLVGMVVVFTGFLAMFNDLGLGTATIQHAHVDHRRVSTLFWTNVAAGAAVAIVTFALAPAIAWFYGDPRLITLTRVISIGFLVAGVTVQHDALLRRQMRFGSLALVDIGALIASIAAAISAAWHGLGYWAVIIGQLTATIARAIGVWAAYRWWPGWPVRRSGIGGMLTFGANLSGFNIVNYLARNVDNLLIGRYAGPGALGLYSKAYHLLLLPLDHVVAPLAAVAVPMLSRLTTSPERYRAAYIRTVEKLAALTMPGVTFMIVCSDWLIEVMLGTQWLEASVMFTFLGIAGLTQPISSSCGWLWTTQGRGAEMLRWGLCGGGLAVLSIVVGLPWGAVGVAASYGISGLVLRAPLLCWYVGRRGPVRTWDIYRAMMPGAAASVAAGAALVLYRHLAEPATALGGLIVGLGVTIAIALTVLLLLPGGRRLVSDAWNVLAELRSHSAEGLAR